MISKVVSRVFSKYPELNVPNALHHQNNKQPKTPVHDSPGRTPNGAAFLIVGLRPLNASCAAVGVNAILDLTSAEHHFKRKLSPTDNEQKD